MFRPAVFASSTHSVAPMLRPVSKAVLQHGEIEARQHLRFAIYETGNLIECRCRPEVRPRLADPSIIRLGGEDCFRPVHPSKPAREEV